MNDNIEKINDEKKNKPKKITLFKVFITITIIVIALILIYTVYSYNNGGMFAGLSILIPFVTIPDILIIIWGLYFLIKGTMFFYKKKKVYGILFIVLVLFALSFLEYKRVKSFFVSDFDTVVSDFDSNEKGYLVYDNKIYYYSSVNVEPPGMLLKMFLDDYSQDGINSINIDGSDNKMLCTNLNDEEYVSEMYMHFIIDGELYYSDYRQSNEFYSDGTVGINKKINLDTCKITDLTSEYRIIPNTRRDNIIYMYGGSDSDLSIVKYDLNKNRVVDVVHTNADLFIDYNAKIDYDNFNIYYSLEDDENPIIYKNDEMIYQSENDAELFIFLISDDYLFFYDDDTIYQMDLNTNEIVAKKDNHFKDIYTIFSDSNDNYFIADDVIYNYDKDLDDFRKINELSDEAYIKNVYHYGDKVLFLGDMRYSILYDKSNNEVKEYSDSYFDYDDNVIHVITYNDESEEAFINKIK